MCNFQDVEGCRPIPIYYLLFFRGIGSKLDQINDDIRPRARDRNDADCSCPLRIFWPGMQIREKVIVGTAVNVFQLYYDADLDVELARLVFGIHASADIAAAALKLGSQLFLRNAVRLAKLA